MAVTGVGTALQLDSFWRWLHEHHNCVLRAGTADAALYDMDDLHWRLFEDHDRNLVVQLLRAKEMVAEFSIDPAEVMYVEVTPSEEEGQHEFSLVGGHEGEPYAMYHFLMAHGYEEAELHRSPPLKH